MQKLDDEFAFTRLVDVLVNGYLQNGMPKSTATRLKHAELRLCAGKQRYLEQQLVSCELAVSLQELTGQPAMMCVAGAELQHCLGVCPEGMLLGVQPAHIRAADPSLGTQGSKSAIKRKLEQRLKNKCLHVVQWHAVQKETVSEGLQLAKASRLAEVVRGEVEAGKEARRRLQEGKREQRDKLNVMHKVLVEECARLQQALEQCKLALLAESQATTLSYLQTKCLAIGNKLDVLYHQLLKASCSEGRLQALQEVRSQLLSAREHKERELVQTQQALQHYQALGEGFASVAGEYREVLAETDNKQWALAELSKS